MATSLIKKPIDKKDIGFIGFSTKNFFNTTRIVFTLVDPPPVGAAGLLINANQNILLELKLDDDPVINMISGNHTFTLTKEGNTFTLQDTAGTLWGTSILIVSAEGII